MRVLRLESWVMAMSVGVLQVVCWLFAPLVLPVWRVFPGYAVGGGIVGGANGEGEAGDAPGGGAAVCFHREGVASGDREAGMCRR